MLQHLLSVVEKGKRASVSLHSVVEMQQHLLTEGKGGIVSLHCVVEMLQHLLSVI